MNKFINTTSIILLVIVPLFGFNFLVNVIGNILLIIVLLPLFVLAISFVAINNFKTKLKQCENCGSIVVGNPTQCINCGYIFSETDNIEKNMTTDASQKTIEVEAEEVN